MRTIKPLTRKNLASRVVIAVISLMAMSASPSLAQVLPDGAKPPATITPVSPSRLEATTAVETAQYGSAAPVRIQMPDLQIDTEIVKFHIAERVVDGVTVREWRQEDIAGMIARHLESSTRPGQGDNVVIAGHAGIEGGVFKNLSAAWDESSAVYVEDGTYYQSKSLEGMTIYLHDAWGRVFTYVVESMYKVAEAGVSRSRKHPAPSSWAPPGSPP